MKYKFYIGEGAEAEKMISECISAEHYASIYRCAAIESAGAANLYCYYLEPDCPRGFVFKTREEREGFRFGAAVNGGFTYFPDPSTDKGKTYQDMLCDQRLRFHAEAWLLRALNIHAEAHGRCEHCRNAHARYKARALWENRQIYLKIPSEANPYPEIPQWLREVKESQWLAAQGK